MKTTEFNCATEEIWDAILSGCGLDCAIAATNLALVAHQPLGGGVDLVRDVNIIGRKTDTRPCAYGVEDGELSDTSGTYDSQLGAL